MRWARNMSFKGKLLLYAASVTGTALMVCCIAVISAEWVQSRRQLPRELAVLANMIGMNTSPALMFNDRDSAEKALQGLKADQNIILATVHSLDGALFAKYTRAGSEDATEVELEHEAFRFSGGRLHLRRPIIFDGDQLGWVYLQHDLQQFYADMQGLVTILAVGMLLALVGAALVSSTVQRVLTGPVTELAHTAATVAKDNDYSVRAVKYSEDELGALTDTFNDMLSQIEERDIALQEHQHTLEDSVSVRTMELAQARGRAEAANEAKSDFLANMSHEIRTPMTAILGFAENMLDANQSESERLNSIHTIRRNGENLLHIINDILDISKIEAGKMTIERRDCHPCRVIAEVASLMRVRADAKKLSLDIAYTGSIPETIRSDPPRLRQILINLIGNSIKFTEAGAVRLVTCLVEDNGAPHLQFDVIDTGHGMTEEQRVKLFQPFVQADNSTTRKFGGTGLGLTISKSFAELLGGDLIVAATELGIGSTFRATVATGSLDGVPMLDDPMSATVVADSARDVGALPPSDLKGLRILLAEDGPDNQRLIAFVLKKAGADVTIEENGKLALDAVLAARDECVPFDVVLMDMQMPVMDGYEATGRLRGKDYTGPIIALTAHAMDGDREKCIKAGCDDYATKPIDRKKLIDTIRRHALPVEVACPATE